MNTTNYAQSPNPTPAQVFRLDQLRVKSHADMLTSEAFREGIDAAMAEYSRRLASAQVTQGQDAAANYFKSVGAHEFVAVLKNLCVEVPAVIVMDRDNLKGNSRS